MQMPTPRPSFQSARIHYRAIRPTDTAIFDALVNDVVSFANTTFANAKPPSPDEAEKFLKETAEDALLAAILWLPHTQATLDLSPCDREQDTEIRRKQGNVVDEQFGTAIGILHLRGPGPHEQHHRTTDVCIDILPQYQGKGYGSEAIRWAMDYAFRRAGLHSMRMRAFGWNVGAIRLYEKLGFVMEGREREAVWFEGRWWDSVTLGMLEDEWRSLQVHEA
ncbi:hypothetical protein PTNB73_03702 [Pyrenophora teres f. teres]|nr:hypothetical protein HRS9139_02665 [Pyrenophora teres f. teres]KAE8844243.1 hypothetical protein PTNB85_02508 [Pyrenophora teres f. teres]KAE8872243.1 hypothetical protein PTNB73_03702 [Pyrenophora teres f. teres]